MEQTISLSLIKTTTNKPLSNAIYTRPQQLISLSIISNEQKPSVK